MSIKKIDNLTFEHDFCTGGSDEMHFTSEGLEFIDIGGVLSWDDILTAMQYFGEHKFILHNT